MSELSANLLKKYETQVPRHSWYPTSSKFHSTFDERHFKHHSILSNSSLLPKDLSIYVQVPFDNSLCHFCGCSRIQTQYDHKKVNNYLEHLLHEIAMRSKLFSDDRLVTQIHFGGGTTSFLNIEQLASVLEQIALQFHLDLPSRLEISIEIDPRAISLEQMNGLDEAGINRFSFAVQEFAKGPQKTTNREQDEGDTLGTIAAAMRLANFVNVDLIMGLAMQSLDGLDEALSRAIDFGVTLIAVKCQTMINSSNLPSQETRLAFSSLVRNRLLQAGYSHIGVDHYALPTDPLALAQGQGTLQRNFRGYTTLRDTDLIGVGVSAISKLDTAFCQNEPTLALYNDRVDNYTLPIAKGIELKDDDRIRAKVIQQIMCRDYVDLSVTLRQFIEKNNATALFDYFQLELIELKKFQKDGLVLVGSGGFKITETGRYFIPAIAAVFERRLKPVIDKHVLPFARNI